VVEDEGMAREAEVKADDAGRGCSAWGSWLDRGGGEDNDATGERQRQGWEGMNDWERLERICAAKMVVWLGKVMSSGRQRQGEVKH
jgi:hypothetical protein